MSQVSVLREGGGGVCDRTDLHQSAFGVTVITLVAITGVVCMFISQRYTQVIFELRSKSWKRTYAHFEIMLVVNVEQIQGTRLESCLKEISNLWHCRQIEAECKRQQRYEVNCLRKTSSDPHKSANFRLLLQIVGLAKKSLGHAVADLDDATAEGDVASATQELHRREIRAHVQDEVCISHPICYDQYNICELVKKSKLSQFTAKCCRKFARPLT